MDNVHFSILINVIFFIGLSALTLYTLLILYLIMQAHRGKLPDWFFRIFSDDL